MKMEAKIIFCNVGESRKGGETSDVAEERCGESREEGEFQRSPVRSEVRVGLAIN